MKKALILSIAITAITAFSISTANAFADNLGSYSADVTVGEVDQTNASDENQDIHSPETGVFRLDKSSESVMVTAIIAAPAIIAVICLFRSVKRERARRAGSI